MVNTTARAIITLMTDREFPWLNTKQAAQRAGLTMAAVSAAIKKGRLPARRVGREWLIHEEDFAEWVKTTRPRK